MANWDLPDRGVVFWPVGNGDAITVVVDDDTIIQFDVNQYETANDDDNDCVPVVDRLLEVLPLPAGADKPILPVLAITHHDADHCSGFERLIDEIQVCEMWITLRSFVEEKDDPGGLTTQGQAVYDEACRRRAAEVKAYAAGQRAEPGDRLRVIGNASVLDDPDWNTFPTILLTSAGEYIPDMNGEDMSDVVEIFVHTPFRSDQESDDRNSTSLGVQLTLKAGTCERRFLLLGDLAHEQIDAFVDKSEEVGNDDRLFWDVLLAPHHCSHAAARRKDGDTYIDAESADHFRRYASDDAVVVASCKPFGADDDQPPHDDAKAVYTSIVGEENFHATADYAHGSDSDPLVIEVSEADCGGLSESKSERMARLSSVAVMKDCQPVAPGDATGGRGDRGFATR
jgi:beta-lactamase superfamily II metal-dependent hydrolase